jgi:hypothetical protein
MLCLGFGFRHSFVIRHSSFVIAFVRLICGQLFLRCVLICGEQNFG